LLATVDKQTWNVRRYIADDVAFSGQIDQLPAKFDHVCLIVISQLVIVLKQVWLEIIVIITKGDIIAHSPIQSGIPGAGNP